VLKRLFVVSVCLLMGCSSFQNPAAPSNTSSNDIPWSPYIVIHSDGGALKSYENALRQLQSHNRIKGARIGLDFIGSSRDTTRLVNSLGIEIVGIMDNNDLVRSDIENVFDQYYRNYPEVKTFQVGNEISTIGNGPHMTMEVYMGVLKRIYRHVEKNYPGVMLVSQSTLGSGEYGPDELSRMVGLGLKEIPPSRLIIGINVYNAKALNFYSSVLTNKLGGYRVWVMESGFDGWDGQIAHVYNVYPRIQNELRAERIYWYVLWNGDSGFEPGFSLIKQANTPQATFSPLLKLLIGQQ